MADIVNLDPYVIGHNGDPQSSAVFSIPNAATKIVGAVINATWNQAFATKAEFTDKITAVMSGFLNTTTTPHVTVGTISVPSIVQQKMIDFRTTYFPDESATHVAAET